MKEVLTYPKVHFCSPPITPSALICVVFLRFFFYFCISPYPQHGILDSCVQEAKQRRGRALLWCVRYVLCLVTCEIVAGHVVKEKPSGIT